MTAKIELEITESSVIPKSEMATEKKPSVSVPVPLLFLRGGIYGITAIIVVITIFWRIIIAFLKILGALCTQDFHTQREN